MEKKNPIEEARRYVANAEEVIQKANYDPELKIYTDGKYIKMAGNTLWNGCLIALDAGFDYAGFIIDRCALLLPKPPQT